MKAVQITRHQSFRNLNKDQPMFFEQCDLEQGGQAINPVSSVALKICASPLVRVGLEEMLEATRFVVLTEQLDRDDTSCDLLIMAHRHHPQGLTDPIITLKTQYPAARMVVLADQFDFGAVMAAWHAGADGFCLMTAGRDVLIHSFELVMLGEVVVPSDLIHAIMGDSVRAAEGSLRLGPENPKSITPPKRPLTNREIEILNLLKEGIPNKVIARKLNLTEATVKVHMKTILRKIGAGNRTQAAIWAADHLLNENAVW
jgi:two-component system nitrate/nitrite response regulator NarL